MNAVVAFSQLMVFDFIGMELKPVYWIRNSHCVDKLVAFKNVSFVTWNAQLKKKRRRVYENTSNIYSYLDILVETMVRYLVVTGALLISKMQIKCSHLLVWKSFHDSEHSNFFDLRVSVMSIFLLILMKPLLEKLYSAIIFLTKLFFFKLAYLY